MGAVMDLSFYVLTLSPAHSALHVKERKKERKKEILYKKRCLEDIIALHVPHCYHIRLLMTLAILPY